MLGCGGKFYRHTVARQWQFIEVINMDDACGRDNKGQPKYVVELRLVDLDVISESNKKSAINFCGNGDETVTDERIAEMCDSYGCRAPIESWSGNNGNQLVARAKRAANELLDEAILSAALQKPVNKIGSTAAEFMNGDFQSAMVRGVESGNPEARIMAKMHGVDQQVIDDVRPDDFLPYLMGYMAATNGSPKETDPDTAPEYFRGYERGENVKAGKCPAPGWIHQAKE